MKLATTPAQGASRTMLALVGLLTLVAIVAVAAAGRAPATGEKVPSSSAHNLLVDYVGTLFLLIMPLGAVVIVWMAFLRRGEIASGRAQRRSWVSYLVVFFVLLLVLVALRAAQPGWLRGKDGQRGTRPLPNVSTVRTPDGQKPLPQARFQWLPVFVLGSLALGLVVSTGMLALRRHRGTLGEPATIEAELSYALDESIDDLLNEPDPRKAVIRTYARMERIFAARGAPKEPFEAPLEYLARALDIVQASAHSAARVTKLFERARFSTHGVDERMKDDAIGALVALRSELEATR